MKNQSGSVLAISAIIALVITIIVFSITKNSSINAHQMVYLDSMSRAYRLAETGMNEAAGRLVTDPKGYVASNGVSVTNDDGVYSSVIQQTNTIIPGGYYIITSATHVVQGRSYSCRLHTHLQVSNVGDYFAAIANDLTIMDGTDASQGRIYAPKLTFNVDNPLLTTKVKEAQFVTSCTPAIDWDLLTKAAIVIGEPTVGQVTDPAKANQPTQLDATIVFPQISNSDLDRYKTLATVHTTKSVFTGDIFPPGYKDGTGGCTAMAGDSYPAHTCSNADHVYYSANDIRIEGLVHGQILFVSEKNIFITGNLTSALVSDPLPGAGFTSSSTAHQAILISPKNVTIDNTYYQVGWNTQKTQTIEALVLAPQGLINAVSYVDTTIHSRLNLIFNGSMILGSQPTNFGTVFNGSTGRTYGYMGSLKTFPPPYLPAIVDVYYSLEEATGGSSIY